MQTKLVQLVPSSPDRERACADRLAAGDVVGGVTNHPDAIAGEFNAVMLPRAAHGMRAEFVAHLRVVREGTKGEVLPEPVVRKLELRATAHVTGEQPLRDFTVRACRGENRTNPG